MGTTTEREVLTTIAAREGDDRVGEVFRGKDGQYYFHIEAANGEIVAQSEGYAKRESAENGVRAELGLPEDYSSAPPS